MALGTGTVSARSLVRPNNQKKGASGWTIAGHIQFRRPCSARPGAAKRFARNRDRPVPADCRRESPSSRLRADCRRAARKARTLSRHRACQTEPAPVKTEPPPATTGRSMKYLTVRHATRYRYAQPATFGPHRLMLRPRDSHDLRLVDAELTLSPPGEIHWTHDVFGNSIAQVEFAQSGTELLIELDAASGTLRRGAAAVFDRRRRRRTIPSSIRPATAATSAACSTAIIPTRRASSTNGRRNS